MHAGDLAAQFKLAWKNQLEVRSNTFELADDRSMGANPSPVRQGIKYEKPVSPSKPLFDRKRERESADHFAGPRP